MFPNRLVVDSIIDQSISDPAKRKVALLSQLLHTTCIRDFVVLIQVGRFVLFNLTVVHEQQRPCSPSVRQLLPFFSVSALTTV